jgi:hypothetical protein
MRRVQFEQYIREEFRGGPIIPISPLGRDERVDGIINLEGADVASGRRRVDLGGQWWVL